MVSRPSKDDYYLNIAKEVGKRGTCLRRNYSAVIVNNDQIVATGYTGAPRGVPNCQDLGVCYRNKAGVPSGSNFELCRSVHAEMNAIIHAGRERTKGAKLYMYGFDVEKNAPIEGKPCLLCKRVIINAGISEVITITETGEIKRYHVDDWVEELKKSPFADLEVQTNLKTFKSV